MHFQTDSSPSIAILRLSAIGDLIMMVPVIRALRRQYPNANLYWITTPLGHQLLKDRVDVNWIVVDKPKSVRQWWRLRKQLRGYRFDVLLAAQASFSANVIIPLIRAKTKIGFDAARARDGQRWWVNQTIKPQSAHLVDGFMQFAAAVGVQDLRVEWGLRLPDDALHWARQQRGDGAWVAVHPMASKTERVWPLRQQIEFITLLRQRNINVVITGGRSEHEQAFNRDLVAGCPEGVVNLTASTSFAQMMAILSEVDVVVAPDTAAVHMARAFGTPVVGLYAVARLASTGPYQAYEYCVDQYDQAVRQFLQREPSEVSWYQRVHNDSVMQLITVDAVMQQVLRLLQSLDNKEVGICASSV